MTTPLAIVSGATGGIGRVVAERLWKKGYSLLALGKTPEKCLALQDWFLAHPQTNQQEYTTAIDLCSARAYAYIERVLQADIHPLTLLVTCHGASPAPGPALLASKAMRRIYETDVFGTFRLCQLAGECMLKQREGCIVLVSSLHARQTYPERVPYATAKASICGMARALAVEWGPAGVRVNTILPWQVRGGRSDVFIEQYRTKTGQDLLELYQQRSPLRRLIEPEEIAEAVLFCTRTPSLTGAEIVLDGGVSSTMWYRGFSAPHDTPSL